MAHGRRGRVHPGGGHENQERWLLTYADMITLLMTFFIVLYSMSKTDVAKFKQISAALERAFNVDIMVGASQGPATSDSSAAAPSIVESFSPEPQFQAEVSRLKSMLEASTVGEAHAPDIAVGATREGIVIRLSGSYLFESGRAELKPNALAPLDTIATELRKLPNNVRVEGHTDNIPVDSPKYPTNWELSVARAVSVTRYLADDGGVQPWRLAAVGYGEYRPLVDNDTREHRSLNRRVEIRILSTRAPGEPSPAIGPPGAAPESTPSAPTSHQPGVRP